MRRMGAAGLLGEETTTSAAHRMPGGVLGGGQRTQQPPRPAENLYQPRHHRLGSVGAEEQLDQLMCFGKRIPFTRGGWIAGNKEKLEAKTPGEMLSR